MTVNTTNLTTTIGGLDGDTLYDVIVYPWDMEGRRGDAAHATQTYTRKTGYKNGLYCFHEIMGKERY